MINLYKKWAKNSRHANDIIYTNEDRICIYKTENRKKIYEDLPIQRETLFRALLFYVFP